jgi:enoyl-CoA hydratase
MSDLVEPQKADIVYETEEPVRYEVIDSVAWITMNRPQFNNAQNGQMTYALDDAFDRAVKDDAVRCIVLAGEGKHFSAGHDIGTPGRDLHKDFDNRLLLPGHINKPAAELLYTREQEQYIGMCKRWREAPKPTVAMVQGACIAGGLMLAWTCDLIVASEDAFFQDPVVRMGIPGVEYFAHAFELPPRVAKEFLLLGERMPAERAYSFGMVNKVVPRDVLRAEVAAIAAKLAAQPRLGAWLTKQAVNHVEELRGKSSAITAAYHMHHFAHAQNDLTMGSSIAGLGAKEMAAANKKQAGE